MLNSLNPRDITIGAKDLIGPWIERNGHVDDIHRRTGSFGASTLPTVLSIFSIEETFLGALNLIPRIKEGFRTEPLEGRKCAVFVSVPAPNRGT